MFHSPLVNLYTRDTEAARAFSADLLGFEETFRTPTEDVPDHVELRLDGFTLGLGSVEAAQRAHELEATSGAASIALFV